MQIFVNRCAYCMLESCKSDRMIQCVECEELRPACRFEDEDVEICTVCDGLLWESLARAMGKDQANN